MKHFQISQVAQQSGTVYVLDRQFHTLQDLVQFYSQHDVPNVEGITGVRLTHPIDNLCNESLRHLRLSSGDATGGRHELDGIQCCSGCSDVIRSLHQSVSQHHKTLKQSSSRSRTNSRNAAAPVLTSPVSGEIVTSETQNSLLENPKKYGKQPAIPDDSTGPAVASVRKNPLFASGSEALAAAAANYNAAATDAAAVDDSDTSVYYSEPRNVDRELSADFIAHLTQQDEQEHTADGKCVCGLYLADSELPRGWSMHISTECGTEGRLFFTSPSGETSWELPTIVSVDLDTEQQDRIRQLMIEAQQAPCHLSTQQMSVRRQFSDGDKQIFV